MNIESKRGLREGVELGIVAGIVFGAMEIIASAAMAQPALAPLRMFASVVLGEQALSEVPLATAAVVGVITHLVLSGLFGLVYGFITSQLSAQTQTSWGRQAAEGMLFGLAVWFVNFQIIARLFYPWFLEAPQFLQALMHAIFYGLPLALMYAAVERRVRLARAPRAV